jgi:hypothetical protein
MKLRKNHPHGAQCSFKNDVNVVEIGLELENLQNQQPQSNGSVFWVDL